VESRRAVQTITSTAAPKATGVQRDAPRQEADVQNAPKKAADSSRATLVPAGARAEVSAGGAANAAGAAPQSSSAAAQAARAAARHTPRNRWWFLDRSISKSLSLDPRDASAADLPLGVARDAAPLVYSALLRQICAADPAFRTRLGTDAASPSRGSGRAHGAPEVFCDAVRSGDCT